jgi:hypothetical protein
MRHDQRILGRTFARAVAAVAVIDEAVAVRILEERRARRDVGERDMAAACSEAVSVMTPSRSNRTASWKRGSIRTR